MFFTGLSQECATFRLSYRKRLVEVLKLYSLQIRRERYGIIYVWKIVEGLVPNFSDPITWPSWGSLIVSVIDSKCSELLTYDCLAASNWPPGHPRSDHHVSNPHRPDYY